jgi:hypothetical protein
MCEMTEKDYSLLRPFDLEAAKAGVLLCDQSGSTLAGLLCCTPDSSGYFRAWVDRIGGLVSSLPGKSIRLAPLCWVEGKPVYPRDMLEHAKHGEVVAKSRHASKGMLVVEKYDSLALGNLAWPRPKPVKRWINIYPTNSFESQDSANEYAASSRIACIEIELPPIKP